MNFIENDIFQRTRLLLGEAAMKRISGKSVIIFGIGGVGSWCAESLVRSGFGKITIVDSDIVCASNTNRQLMATSQTVGQVKVEALKRRLLEINPAAEITAIQQLYCAETADLFQLEKYDYIIDAIDSLQNKALLILNACRTDSTFFSSMGAALKINPAKVQVAEFWNIKGCPLAAALRRKFKKMQNFPAKKFKCVFSDELLQNADEESDISSRINGTLAHITAIFGFTLAALVIMTEQ